MSSRHTRPLEPVLNLGHPYSLRTIEKLIRLHDAGWTHGTVREEHILFPDAPRTRRGHVIADPDGPFLISLSHARPHRCSRSLSIIESTLRPPREAFGCDELYTVAAVMGIWNPGKQFRLSLPGTA